MSTPATTLIPHAQADELRPAVRQRTWTTADMPAHVRQRYHLAQRRLTQAERRLFTIETSVEEARDELQRFRLREPHRTRSRYEHLDTALRQCMRRSAWARERVQRWDRVRSNLYYRFTSTALHSRYILPLP